MGRDTVFKAPSWDRVNPNACNSFYIDGSGERRYQPRLAETVAAHLFGSKLAEYLSEATGRYCAGDSTAVRVLARRDGLFIERSRPDIEDRDIVSAEDYIAELHGTEYSDLRAAIMHGPYDPPEEVVDATMYETVQLFTACYIGNLAERHAAILNKMFGQVISS